MIVDAKKEAWEKHSCNVCVNDFLGILVTSCNTCIPMKLEQSESEHHFNHGWDAALKEARDSIYKKYAEPIEGEEEFTAVDRVAAHCIIIIDSLRRGK